MLLRDLKGAAFSTVMRHHRSGRHDLVRTFVSHAVSV
jgi:hypothetical protein